MQTKYCNTGINHVNNIFFITSIVFKCDVHIMHLIYISLKTKSNRGWNTKVVEKSYRHKYCYKIKNADRLFINILSNRVPYGAKINVGLEDFILRRRVSK